MPKNYVPVPYKWDNAWIVKTPPGWSCLFQHPAWHDHLPFRSLPAIVDTDKLDIPVKFPFLLEESFSGLIPRNTPIAQVIPLKREDVSATYTWDKNEEYRSKYYVFFSTLFQTYKRFVRQPKNYSIEQGGDSKCPFSSPKQ